jgi:hypothetical protein
MEDKNLKDGDILPPFFVKRLGSRLTPQHSLLSQKLYHKKDQMVFDVDCDKEKKEASKT